MMDTKLYAKGFATAWHAALLACALLISPLAVNASEITGLSLEKSAEGDVLSISFDGELDYQSFDLSAPDRLVLTFPGATFSKNVEAIAGGESGVGNVSTSVAKTGARLDITLSRALTYKVEQQEKSLVLRFSPVSGSQAKVAQQTAVLKDISIADQGDMTEMVVRGEHMNASHDAFVTNHGRTLIMDFWGAESMLPKEHFSAATQKVQSVTVGEAKGRVRLVVNLLPGVSDKHQIDATASQMIVRFGSVAAKRKAAVVQVEQVLFKPNDRISQMVIRTNVSNPVVSLHEEKGAAILDIKKAALAKGQERSQNVSDFPGPLSQIDAYKAGDKVRIVARLRDKVEISSFQQGNVLTVTFVPKDIASARRGSTKGDAFEYTGQKLTVDYQGTDIRNALRLIAEMSDMNIIMGEDVQGKLNMRLENVPWDQALDIILTSQGLGKQVQGNVMRIAPQLVLTKERMTKLEAGQSAAELAPLITEYIPLRYAKVEDVEAMLNKAAKNESTQTANVGNVPSDATVASANASFTQNRILSERGSFVIDPRTNTLIVKDTEESINNVKRLVVRIDTPVKQVLIEARIVEASDNFTRDLGIRWGGQVSGKSGRVTHQLSNNA
ncbi:MAG: AMIN domain-containing protein, partial [Mariprofundaceae bacterium]|nr:AMIN domain-containing protein [Mariprofundaceae bacterium]